MFSSSSPTKPPPLKRDGGLKFQVSGFSARSAAQGVDTWKPPRGVFFVFVCRGGRGSSAFNVCVSHFVASFWLSKDTSLVQGEGQVLEHRQKSVRGLSFWHFCRRLFFGLRATRPGWRKKATLSSAGKPLLECVQTPVQLHSAFLSGVQWGEEIAEVGFPTALAKNTVQGEHANKASTKVGGRP